MSPASNLRSQKSPSSGFAASRDRLEPLDSIPLRPGRCDWCGRKVRGRVYCSPACRVSYNNLLTRQGKALAQTLKVWRIHRGRAGTRGAGKLTTIAARVDHLLEEDRARWRAEADDGGNA